MHTALRRTTVVALGAALATTTFAALPRAADAATTPCQFDCVSLGTVQSGPEGARFEFSTTGLTHTTVVVSDSDGANPTRYGQQDGYFWSTDYDIVVPRAQQGMTYKYVVTATDVSGHSWQETGYFATLIRTAVVSFSSLYMIDDSDSYSPGDLVGAARCTGTNAGWRDVAPLSQLMDHEIEVSSGTTLPMTGSVTCYGVPKTVPVDTTVADDDNTGIPYIVGWYPGDFYAGTGSDCCWDWASTHHVVTDPIPDYATATSLPIPFSDISPGIQDNGDHVGSQEALQYTINGSVTFKDLPPPVQLPAPTVGPVGLGLKVTPGVGMLTLSWSQAPLTGAYPVGSYRVDYRPTGQAGWQSVVLGQNVSTWTLSGLTNGQSYEVQVSKLTDYDVPVGLTSGAATPYALATTISGWSTATSVLPYKSTVTNNVSVTTGGLPRGLVLQYRLPGSATWTYYKAVLTTAAGSATLTYPVLAGTVQWRVGAPATSTYQLSISAPRSITSATTVAGFSTTTTAAKTGTALSDGIVVTPGASRLVYVMYRKSGTTPWSAYTWRTASSAGAVTVPLAVKAGWYQWRVYVPASPTRGAAVWGPVRLLHGT